ncbi:DNA-3-methyladenine glycosylase I [Sanguibacter sp. HDW7]|uniref:DNA-3-methyladenine glycosylase I n=1 Tax=Sanguibacter sp. HDW7 TaxID=2714931 RepID=UPI00140C541B|nr:DNA-3-methyladenine glycosylase I [Sanguibacter sp. HDW7]QIK83041.1 DNA-3-methyladenine glycosylase I [Sanguibacter sp. HDW7]
MSPLPTTPGAGAPTPAADAAAAAAADDAATADAPARPDLVVGDDGLARPRWAAADALLRDYYDTEWGMPVRDEHGLFERLSLEAFQSGLSWATVLRKRPAFREVFAGFDPEAVARFDDADTARLLDDARIIRNRAKVLATVQNARATLELRADGGLAELVWSYRPDATPAPRSFAEVPSTSPESRALAKDLKKRGFTFVGPTTVFALMEAVGVVDTHLVGSHRRGTSGVWA